MLKGGWLLEGLEGDLWARRMGPEKPRATILWLHGLGSWGHPFLNAASHPDLAPFRSLVPDLPGYGRSSHPRPPLDLDGVARTLACWLGDRVEGPCVLVGHSLGGVLGQIIAERHGAGVSGLINVEGNLSGEDCTVSGKAAALTPEEFRREGFEALVGWAEQAGRKDPQMAGYASSLRLADPAAVYIHSRDLLALSEAGDLAARLASLTIPALYVAGHPNGIGPRSRALLKAAGVATASISPAGHCPFLDQPEAFAQTVAAFVERCSPASREGPAPPSQTQPIRRSP